MALKPRKTLLNPFASLSQAEFLAQKTDKALQTYPFSDISSDLHLKINPRAKRMALRVDIKQRKVNLVLPKRASMRDAYKFALEHKYWIREKIAEIPKPIKFEHGAVISILGEPTEIIVDYKSTLKRTYIALKNNKIIVSTNKEDPSSRIKRFIINLAKEQLSALAHEKAEITGKAIQIIDVKDTTSRWGSCSSDGKVCFSWRLIFAPYDAFDYVVAHEVAHLTHMDHSPDFWNHCADLSRNYSRGKTWMKRHSGELTRYT
ncbi:MAG TPA: SprT family zinc-dependent metalloprotease [Alphaproteobacteria bacterium]|nr:SprT family zinc-dependent metalloprotease [Alphaproteobacteria bacterium]